MFICRFYTKKKSHDLYKHDLIKSSQSSFNNILRKVLGVQNLIVTSSITMFICIFSLMRKFSENSDITHSFL